MVPIMYFPSSCAMLCVIAVCFITQAMALELRRRCSSTRSIGRRHLREVMAGYSAVRACMMPPQTWASMPCTRARSDAAVVAMVEAATATAARECRRGRTLLTRCQWPLVWSHALTSMVCERTQRWLRWWRRPRRQQRGSDEAVGALFTRCQRRGRCGGQGGRGNSDAGVTKRQKPCSGAARGAAAPWLGATHGRAWFARRVACGGITEGILYMTSIGAWYNGVVFDVITYSWGWRQVATPLVHRV